MSLIKKTACLSLLCSSALFLAACQSKQQGSTAATNTVSSTISSSKTVSSAKSNGESASSNSSSSSSSSSSESSGEVALDDLTTTVKVAVASGSYTTAEGNDISVYDDHTFRVDYPNGDYLSTYSDNTYSLDRSDVDVSTYSDGTYSIKTSDGVSISTYSDGSYSVTLADGTDKSGSNLADLTKLTNQYGLPKIETYNGIVASTVNYINQNYLN